MHHGEKAYRHECATAQARSQRRGTQLQIDALYTGLCLEWLVIYPYRTTHVELKKRRRCTITDWYSDSSFTPLKPADVATDESSVADRIHI